MSFVDISEDNTYWIPAFGSNSIKVGTTYRRWCSGENGKSKDWHDYSTFGAASLLGYYTEDIFYNNEFVEQRKHSIALSGAMSILRPRDTNEELVLLNKLTDKIREHNYNIGIAAAEMGKTTDMICSRVRQLASSVRLARKGNFAGAAKLLVMDKDSPGKPLSIPNNWNEYRYGWRPLLKDIYDLSEAIRVCQTPPQTEVRTSHWIGYEPHHQDLPGGGKIVMSGTGKYRKSIIARFDADSAACPSIPAYLGLADPEVIVWELIPYSFVVDWVLPIGTYLSVESLLRRFNATYLRTTHQFYDVTASVSGSTYLHPDGLTKSVFAGGPTCKEKFYSTSRVKTSHLDIPLPMPRNPLGNNPATRFADAASLLAAAFGRS